MTIKLTIIGGGPGGYVAAVRAAQRGAEVSLVEKETLGGTCLNWGCIPTKALIASTRALESIRHAADFGIDVESRVSYNLERIRDRKDKIVATQVKGIQSLLKSWGVSIINGRGMLLSGNVVRVELKEGGAKDIASDRIILATGSRPARIPGFPFDGERVLTSDDAVQLKKVPKSILIIGAGVIGSEFAFIYRSLGADVTLAEMMPHALSTEDEEISEILEREFKKAKIKLLSNVKVDAVTQDEDSLMSAKLSNGKEVKAEQVLVSIGRHMNSENLGLDTAGVKTGKRGEIVVNERMETTKPDIFAIGDVTGNIMLAHVASRQGLVAVENALGGNACMDYSIIPGGIFTTPEVGSVGLRESQIIEKGLKYRVGRFQYRALGKAHAMGEISGMVKILAEEASDRILGVHICGAHAADLVHEGALAMKSGATARELGQLVHAHPTLAEAILEAAEDVHGSAIHLPKPGK